MTHPAEAWPRCQECGQRPDSLRMPAEGPANDVSDHVITLNPCGHKIRIPWQRWVCA